MSEGIVIVGSTPAMPLTPVPALLATTTAMAPAFWAILHLDGEPTGAAVDERDLAGQRAALGSGVQASEPGAMPSLARPTSPVTGEPAA